jgi:xanthine dehydrogenase YagS FAD-binding subunit
MKDFKLAEPKSLLQAAAFLAGEEGRATPIAGGTDLLGLLKEGIVEPETVVDLAAVPGLAGFRMSRDGMHIGALMAVTDLAAEPTVKQAFPVLHQAANAVGSPQLRNMGTVGGNLCQRPRCWYFRDLRTVCRKKGGGVCFAVMGRNRYHAILGASVCHMVYPSDLAPALISLDAKVTIVSPKGERRLPLESFYALPSVDVRRENVLLPGELLSEVVVPVPAPGTRSAYLKFMERGAWDFAVVSAAATATLSGKRVEDVRLVMGGVAPVPWRLEPAEALLRGKPLSEASIRAALAEGLRNAKPMSENAYKIDLAKVVAGRALASLTART